MAEEVYEFNMPMDEFEALTTSSDFTGMDALPAEEPIGYFDARNIVGMGREALQGATFGLANKAGAGIASLLGGGSYEDIRQAQDIARAEYAQQAPVFSNLANIAGGFAIPAGGVLKLGAKGVGLGAKAAAKAIPYASKVEKTAETVANALMRGGIPTGAAIGVADAVASTLGEGGTVEQALGAGVLGGGIGAVGGGVANALTRRGGTKAERELADTLAREGYTPSEVDAMVGLAQEAKQANIPASIVDIETLPIEAQLPLKKSGVFRRAQNVSQVAKGAQAQSSEILAQKRIGDIDRIKSHLDTLSNQVGKDLTRDELAGFYKKVADAASDTTEENLENALYKQVYKEYPLIKPSEEARVKTKDPATGATSKPTPEAERKLLEERLKEISRPSVTGALEKVKADEVAAGRDLDKVMLEPRFWGKVRGQLSTTLRTAERAKQGSLGFDVEPSTVKKAIKYLDDKLDSYTNGEHAKSRQLLAQTVAEDPALYSPKGIIRQLAKQDAAAVKGSTSTLDEIFGPNAKFEGDIDDLIRIVGGEETRAAAKQTYVGQMKDKAGAPNASKILESQKTMKQLKSLLRDRPEDFELLKKKLLFEKSIEQNFARLQGGSDTAAKAVEEGLVSSWLKSPIKVAQSQYEKAVTGLEEKLNAQYRREIADLLLNPERTVSGLAAARKLMEEAPIRTWETAPYSLMAQKVAESLARTVPASASIPTRIVITPRRD